MDKINFKYKEPFVNCFDFRHHIDDPNNCQHTSPSFEEAWVRHRWINRVFVFLLVAREINTFLVLTFFLLGWCGRIDYIDDIFSECNMAAYQHQVFYI